MYSTFVCSTREIPHDVCSCCAVDFVQKLEDRCIMLTQVRGFDERIIYYTNRAMKKEEK